MFKKGNCDFKKIRVIFFIILVTMIYYPFSINNCYPQSWATLGSGVGSTVNALTIYNGDLIAAGYFTTAGGVSASKIAKWNGTSWSPLGSGIGPSGNSVVYALAVYNGELIAAGGFTSAGGIPANNIAKWNGTTWSTLGTGMESSTYPQVNCLTVYNNELIAGGRFTVAGGVFVNKIAKWNGSNWSALGTGIANDNHYLYSLCVYNNELHAGGNFTSISGVSANNIAKWNGATWLRDSTGLDYIIQALTVYNNELIAGGWFTNYLAKWNGTSWTAFNTTVNSQVYSLGVYNNDLYVGGWFGTAGSVNAKRIARWNGTNWFALDSGLNQKPNALTVYNNELIAAGEFTTAGEIPANYIAKWGLRQFHDISCGPFLNAPYNVLTNSTTVLKTIIKNLSIFTETNVPVKLTINETLVNTSYKNFNPGQVDSVSNSWIPTVPGTYNIKYIVASPVDSNRYNDTVKTIINAYSSFPPLPPEEFISIQFPPQGWTLDYTGTLRWSRALVSGYGQGVGSAKFDFRTSPPGTMQSLISPNFSTATVSTDSLVFDNAYATLTNQVDVLYIDYSTNYGAEWNLATTLLGGVNGQLVTAPPTTTAFTPTADQWKRQVIGLPPGTNKVRFRPVSMWGNNLYLDSIRVGPNLITGMKENHFPLHYCLSQNFPNPFNPTTNIQFELPKSSFVKLTVYDILGREIQSLVNEIKQAGRYSVDFNGSDLTSGVYFYKIQAGDFMETKRMILIK